MWLSMIVRWICEWHRRVSAIFDPSGRAIWQAKQELARLTHTLSGLSFSHVSQKWKAVGLASQELLNFKFCEVLRSNLGSQFSDIFGFGMAVGWVSGGTSALSPLPLFCGCEMHGCSDWCWSEVEIPGGSDLSKNGSLEVEAPEKVRPAKWQSLVGWKVAQHPCPVHLKIQN